MIKKSKRKLFLLGGVIIASCFALAACNHQEEQDSSSLQTSDSGEGCGPRTIWNYNTTTHWHDDTCTYGVKYDEGPHDFVESGKHATYEASGKITYTCKVCGYTYNVTEQKLAHHFSDEWTFNEVGHWHQCIDEGYESLQSSYSKHTYTEDVVEPTYEKEGTTTYTCSACGYSYTTTQAKLVHTYSDKYESDETGHWHRCLDEGFDNLTTEVEAHDYEDTVVKEATYSEKGLIRHKCSICRYVLEEEIPTKEHNYSDVYQYNSEKHWKNCTDPGFENLKDEEETHTIKEKVVAPTYESQGYTLHKCEKCDYSYKDNYVDQLEHHFSDEWEHDEWRHWHLCTDQGYEALKGDEELHDYEVISTVEPTFTEYGYSIVRCEVCGYETKRIGHEYKEHNFYDEYQSNENGHWHLCKDVGYETLTSEVEAHEYGDYVLDSLPTASEHGLCHRVCKHCGYAGAYEHINKSAYYSLTGYTFYCPTETTVYINGYNGPQLDTVIIPQEIDGRTVVGMNSSIFMNCSWLKEAYVMANCESTSDSLFRGCNNLERVVLWPSYRTIGTCSFYGCLKLTSVNLDNISTLNNMSFYRCCDLEEVELVGIVSLGESIFSNCELLKSVSISGTLSSVSAYCFYYCTSLETVDLSQSIQTINNYAFYSCTSLKYIKVPDQVYTLGDHAFANCTSLETVVLGTNIWTVNSYSFYNSFNIKNFYWSFSETERYSRNINFYETYTYKFYYYSASIPSSQGNYWRYVDGVPTPW